MTLKIPPHVARELARHLVPKKTKPSVSSSSSSSYSNTNGIVGTRKTASSSQQQQRQQRLVLFGTLTFLGAAFSIPFVAIQWVGRLTDKEEGLTAAQIRRGAFNNSGSRDVGRDPKWDFEKGVYKKDADYQDIFARDDPTKIDHGEEFHRRS